MGSELLRSKVTDKYFGYTAGAGQGMAGAMLAGAAFGGPIGAAIGGGLYGITEGFQMRQQTNALLDQGQALNAEHVLNMARDIGKTDVSNPFANAKVMLANLTNQQNALDNLKESDAQYESGYSGAMMRLLHVSKRQFGAEQQAELSKVTQQKDIFSKAVQSGDSNKVIEAMASLQAELVKLSAAMSGPEQAGAQSKVSSDLNVKSDVQNADRIPAQIEERLITPILEKLAALQGQVNELVNQRTPMPAQIGS